MLNGDQNFKSNSSEPLKVEGITFPVGNNTWTEILDSVCVINGYFEKLPGIIRNLTVQHQDMIRNTAVFHKQFRAAAQSVGIDLHGCHTDVERTDDFSMKLLGIQIIHYSKLWVKSLTGTYPTCESLQEDFR